MSDYHGRLWVSADPDNAVEGIVELIGDRIVVKAAGSVLADWDRAKVAVTPSEFGFQLTEGDDVLIFHPTTAGFDHAMGLSTLRERLSAAASGGSTGIAPATDTSAVPHGGGATFCRACGRQIDPRAELCVHCGVRQRQYEQYQKSRMVAALLALFLGGIGVHKFYLGQIGLGVLYLIFFWTFIPALIALVEAIILFSMSDVRFDEKYNR